jgi:Fur family ferric uptake transcriptional regulator
MIKNQKILDQLRTKGYKMTDVRCFIIAFLTKNKKPTDALKLQKALAKSVRTVNKTTVYRELEFLVKQKIIVEINFGDGKMRYEIADLPHHHHLICSRCQKVEDVYVDDQFKNFETKIKKQKSFTILNHSLEFFGLCRSCNK